MTLRELRRLAQQMHLDAKAIDRLISNDGFTCAWSAASIEDQALVESMVKESDRLSLLKWLEAASKIKPLKELKVMAKKAGVPGWYLMTRDELMEALRD